MLRLHAFVNRCLTRTVGTPRARSELASFVLVSAAFLLHTCVRVDFPAREQEEESVQTGEATVAAT